MTLSFLTKAINFRRLRCKIYKRLHTPYFGMTRVPFNIFKSKSKKVFGVIKRLKESLIEDKYAVPAGGSIDW